MNNFLKRLGVLPSLLLGLGLLAIGLLTMNHIVDHWWPFDVARIDLVRDTALDRLDAASILEAASTEVILAFLGAVLVAVTGLMLPLAFFLNKRFSRTNPQEAFPEFLMTLRQSMWVGLWVAFCIWLQMNRTLGFAVAGLVAAFFILFELLLQVRTRAASVAG